MSGDPNAKVFISYARKDGSELANKLCTDLKRKGLTVWLDTRDLRGGATWTTEIEQALDECDVALALLTHGSYVSEICRAEQLRALRHGKCVIPLRAQKNTDIALHLETKNYRDFAGGAYQERFAELLNDIAHRNGIALKPEYRETYITAPPFPPNYVERPQELIALRNAVITENGGRAIALTALQGMGGIGKTVLAQALCHEDVVQQAFPDGIIWITAGKEYDLVTKMREVAKGLNDDLARYDTELGCKNQYRTTIRKKAALIVVDDVWSARDLEPFRAESLRSRLLFTTRDAEVASVTGAREHPVQLLDEAQSREVLANGAGISVNELPADAAEIIRECGRLPLALAMVGAMLRRKPREAWARVLTQLRNADLAKIRAEFPDYPHTDLLRAIQVSVDGLDQVSRDRYLRLAVLLEDMTIDPAIQRTLWKVDESEAAETAERFVSRALAQRDGEGIRLHDVQMDYVRAQYPDQQSLRLIREAVRLSSHVIAKDPTQFGSQIIGRLLGNKDQPTIGSFIDELKGGAARPALQPMYPALHPPGTALLRTLAGHTAWVNGVALSGDGRRAVSASDDQTLKVWDVESGRELRRLAAHTASVRGVALSGDGRRAVSASEDHTLKVWDVESGRELRTLAGHTESVEGVALSADGRRAVSASEDHTLKVWDVESGRELGTLAGHTASVKGVALSGDGRRAVSASDGRRLKVWDMESGRELRTLAGHTRSVKGVALSGDGRRAVSASDDQTLKVWDVESGRELRTLAGHTGSVREVALSGDGRRAVSASDETLKVWDVESGRELRGLAGHTAWVTGVTLSGDGRQAVSASTDRTLKVWDVESGRELRRLAGHTAAVDGVALSADGRQAVSASWDQTLKVWDVESGRELRTLAGHTAAVDGVALSGDGRRAVSASDDQTLKVWDVESGRELRTLAGHTNWVDGVALSGDGRRAVSASRDKTLKVWDVESGCVVATFTCDSLALSCSFASPHIVVAGDAGGRIHFLRLDE